LLKERFCHATPAALNSLPQSITTNISYFTSFNRLLKTENVNRAYITDVSFFPHSRFFKIVHDFNVRHQPFYNYDYDDRVLMKGEIKRNALILFASEWHFKSLMKRQI